MTAETESSVAECSARVALVSGAGSGIGRATATLLGQSDVRVVGLDIDQARLQETDRAGVGSRFVAVRGDVTVSDDVDRAVDTAIKCFGRLDYLVNNAGIGMFGKRLEEISEEEWDNMLAVNLKSVFLLARAAVPHLRKSDAAAIVNVASIHALATSDGLTAYAAAKGGVVALTRALAIDLAIDGIRVNSVLPGAVDTPLLRRHAEIEGVSLEEWGLSFDRHVIGRIGEAREISTVIQFLLSANASFVNGATIVADGGMIARFSP